MISEAAIIKVRNQYGCNGDELSQFIVNVLDALLAEQETIDKADDAAELAATEAANGAEF